MKSSVPGYLLAGAIGAAVLTVALSKPCPGPTPGPGPVPPGPPPDPSGSFLVMVTDNDNPSSDNAAVRNSDDLALWLVSKKIGWRTIDKGGKVFTDDGYDKILADAGVQPAAVVLWAPGNVSQRAAVFPGTVDALKQWILGSPHTGPPSIEVDGVTRYLTCLPPSQARFMAPRGGEFSAVHAPIPRSSWKEIDNRKKFPPEKWIYDQDGIGSCVGNGSTAALRKARAFAGFTDVRLAPGCVYAQINGGRDQGAVISDSLTALQQTGTISSATLGSDEKPFYSKQMPSGWKTEAARFRIEEAYHCSTFDDMATALQYGFVIVYGMQVGNSFNHFTGEGVAGASPGPGNHCMHADGLHHLPDGSWALDNVNSWGDWGPWKGDPVKQGRCYLVEKHFLQGDVPDAYAVKTAVEDPLDPIKPPKRKAASQEELLGIVAGPASWLLFNEPEKQAARCNCVQTNKCGCSIDDFRNCTCKQCIHDGKCPGKPAEPPVPPPGVKQATLDYWDARPLAIKGDKPLIVFVNQPAYQVPDGYIVSHHEGHYYYGPGKRVVASVPDGKGELFTNDNSNLDGSPDVKSVVRAVETLQALVKPPARPALPLSPFVLPGYFVQPACPPGR